MRQIGSIEHESQSRVFRSYLLTRGIHSDVEPNREGRWAVWVHEETRLDEARGELEQFLADPRDERYQAAAKTGEEIESARKKEEKKFRGRQVDLRTHWHLSQAMGGTVTLCLIFFSVATYLLQKFPSTQGLIEQWFSIASIESQGNYITFHQDLFHEIKRGQVWRLVTPAFLHFGVLHILFNMLWLRHLGGAVESAEGSGKLILHFLIYAIAGNLLQVVIGDSPRFGGMSGVNFGLFAYVWLMGKYSTESRYFLDQATVVLMLIWFGFGVFGVVGGIANGAHAGGLIAGALWAIVKLRRIPFTQVRF